MFHNFPSITSVYFFCQIDSENQIYLKKSNSFEDIITKKSCYLKFESPS